MRLTADGSPSSSEPINDEQTSRCLRGWVVRQTNWWHTSLLSNKNTRSPSALKAALHPVRASTFPLEWQLQDVRWDRRGMPATTPILEWPGDDVKEYGVYEAERTPSPLSSIPHGA